MEAPREIKHALDRPYLGSLGANLNDPALQEAYWEWRNLATLSQKPGMLPEAVLMGLRIDQMHRQAEPPPDRMAAARAAKKAKQLTAVG
jgi:hypothetical protein